MCAFAIIITASSEPLTILRLPFGEYLCLHSSYSGHHKVSHVRSSLTTARKVWYTALCHHRNLTHLHCPGYAKAMKKPRLDRSDSDSSDSTFVLDELQASVYSTEDLHGFLLASTTASRESDSSESAVCDDASGYSSENDSDATEVSQSMKPLVNRLSAYPVKCL